MLKVNCQKDHVAFTVGVKSDAISWQINKAADQTSPCRIHGAYAA